MNTAAYDRAYDKVVPTDSPEIARIMQERGVGRRRATHLLTKERAESIDVSGVALSAKEMVLTTLIKYHFRNSDELAEHLRHHTDVHTTDGHDVVKMLWACQKQGWVTFRERKANGTHPAIYAIKVTPKGYADAKTVVRPRQPVEMGGNQAHTLPEAAQAAKSARRLDGDPPPTYDAPLKPTDVAFRSRLINLDGYPLIKGLMDRSEKGIFLTNAAQILERAGEEDLALAVMEKNQFTPLEEEVARFVKRFRPVMNKKEE